MGITVIYNLNKKYIRWKNNKNNKNVIFGPILHKFTFFNTKYFRRLCDEPHDVTRFIKSLYSSVNNLS